MNANYCHRRFIRWVQILAPATWYYRLTPSRGRLVVAICMETKMETKAPGDRSTVGRGHGCYLGRDIGRPWLPQRPRAFGGRCLTALAVDSFSSESGESVAAIRKQNRSLWDHLLPHGSSLL